MTAKWEKTATNEGVLTFSVDQKEIQKGLTVAFNRVKKNLNVPGFRKGKVSRTVFDRMYGEESLYEDALNAVLPANYDAAVAEAGINPVSQPEINVKSMNKGEDWVITAKVTVKPEVKLGEYKNLTVAKQDREASEADVDARLADLQKQHAELVVKEEEAVEVFSDVVNEKRILVLCAGGGTSGLLANALAKGAKEKGISIVTAAGSYGAHYDMLKDYDLVVLAPQVANYYQDLKKDTDRLGIKCVACEGKKYIELTRNPQKALEFVFSILDGE